MLGLLGEELGRSDFLSQTKWVRSVCGSAWGLEIAQENRLVKKDSGEGIDRYGLADNGIRAAKS